MIKKIYLLALLVVISLVLYIYLTKDFYQVQYLGPSGESICSINQTFDCESVAASSYSSLFGEVPNALLGLFLNLVLLIGLLAMAVKKDDDEGFKSWFGFSFSLASINLLASLVMAFVAFAFMDVYCLFCMSLYILSLVIFVIFFLIYQKENPLNWGRLFKSKILVFLILSIPVGALISHQIIKKDYSPAALQKEIQSSLKSWKKQPEQSFLQPKPLFDLNPEGEVKAVEFADFLCPHCSNAYKTFKSFLKAHKDFNLKFYVYPLDPTCSPNFDPGLKGPGYTCTLAAGVYCAQKQGQGEPLYSHIFENQKDYFEVAQKNHNEGLIKKMKTQLNKIKDPEAWNTCLKAPDTLDYLKASAQLGKAAGVQGTPTVYVDNKKLKGGAIYLMLKEAYESLK